jgi:hypothetical protein
MDDLRQDLRYTFRTMRRDPAFALIALLILAVGIGANVAVFSLVNTILLRPLPFQAPERLVWIEGPPREGGLSSVTYSVDAFEEYQQRNDSLASVTGYMPFYGPADYKLTGRGEPQPVSGVMVECNFFQTLGVQPALGRLFTADECRKNAAPVVLLSYFFWEAQLGGDTSIVGGAITLNNAPVTVVGKFRFRIRLCALHQDGHPGSGTLRHAQLGKHSVSDRPPEAGNNRGANAGGSQPVVSAFLFQ